MTTQEPDSDHSSEALPGALSMLASKRPRNVGWLSAGGLLFGDWGTSRLYVLGLAFFIAGRTSFFLICAMSLLILAVGWAYTQICRIYSDGGGVYTAGRQRHALIGLLGALLLFADYTVTASLSAMEAFHYFGIGAQEVKQVERVDPGDRIKHADEGGDTETHGALWNVHNPAMWAIFSLIAIGGFNLMGPKHTAGYAIFTAVGMIIITLLIVGAALPQINWSELQWGSLHQPAGELWYGFVYIVLALSGVEAIANLTGVMKKPVYTTAKKSIWLVAIEVAVFNVLLAIVMLSLASTTTREAHTGDMLAFMTKHYVPWGEWPVRIIGGLLLLSASNTAVGALTGTVYVMSRDGELPAFFQKLNGFGAPWIATALATAVPVVVLLAVHELKTLASMYAIGVVGAVAINCTLTTFHPRLRHLARKASMGALGALLIAIWVTLAWYKPHALAFVTIVVVTGMVLRQLTRFAAGRRPKPSLLRRAIIEQLPTSAMDMPKVMLATAGSDTMARPALEVAKRENAALVVCFVRDVALNYKIEAETQFTLDTDPAALALFTDFLEHGHRMGIPIIPVYDTGPNSVELLAEHAAVSGVLRVLIGSSRRGTLHQLIKGSFQKKLESLLPPEIPVEVLSPHDPALV